MIKSHRLLPLLLPLTLAAAVAHAQPDNPDGDATAPVTADPGSETGRVAGDGDTDAGQNSAPRRDESPFEYRPSEEISEDLPVSFPVDI